MKKNVINRRSKNLKKRFLWVRVTQLAFLVCLLSMAAISTDFGQVSMYTHHLSDFKLLYMLYIVFIVRGLGLMFVLQKSAAGLQKKTASRRPVIRGIVCELLLISILIFLAYKSF